MVITEPGIYEIPLADYLADPCPAPSLNASVANLLVERSPRHAWQEHPRLNPIREPNNSTKFDIGSAIHALVLGAGNELAVIDAENYRTKAAQEARDDAYAKRMIPVLTGQMDGLAAVAQAIQAQLSAHEFGNPFDDLGTKVEQTLVWEENGVWCRIRPDWLPLVGNMFGDLKTTTDANPETWGRRVFWETGCDMTTGLYRRGLSKLLGVPDPQFHFVVAEIEPPYAVSVITPSPAIVHMADAKAAHAIDIWRWCTTFNRWPGYARRIATIEAPPWQVTKFEDREIRGQIARESGDDLIALGIEWQAPL